MHLGPVRLHERDLLGGHVLSWSCPFGLGSVVWGYRVVGRESHRHITMTERPDNTTHLGYRQDALVATRQSCEGQGDASVPARPLDDDAVPRLEQALAVFII